MTRERTSKLPGFLRLSGQTDQLFQKSIYPTPFEFNREVAHVFDDMAVRSIPGYVDVIRAVCQWSQQFYQPNSRIYDLGCSTGTTSAAIIQHVPSAFVVGVDESAPMIERAREKLVPEISGGRCELINRSLEDVHIERASVVVLNYTLQFIPVSKRKSLIKTICDGLLPGGILFVSEKTRASCPEFQEAKVSFYEEFKREAGYSQTEIEKKKESLDRVLVPYSLDELSGVLLEGGFASQEIVYAAHHFISLVALKK